MSKLSVDQKTVKDFLSDKKNSFLIPDYQRPYAWGRSECDTLWNDLFSFAFPDNDYSKFDDVNDEYFLGPVVTFPNSEKKQEVIDGQQRLTTLMLLLRAFYPRFENMQDKRSIATRQNIEQCLWKTSEFDEPDMTSSKLETEVATDEAKQEFSDILQTGATSEKQKSNYAENYRFFQAKIDEFMKDFGSYLAYFPTRIMNNCILLPIEADSSEVAMRIFSTLNDRGKPLSDADIFKSQLYKHYAKADRKDEFIARWKELEEVCQRIYHPITGTPMDEAFTRYMYYERAKQGNKLSTIESLRKFYEKDSYSLLQHDETFDNIVDLAKFWGSVAIQDKARFSDRILRRLFVLNYAPNGMWTYITSVYYIVNRDKNGLLDEEKFRAFLHKITAFIWGYSFLRPGLNALRTPLFAEMVNIFKGEEVTFSEYKLPLDQLTSAINNYVFTNNRPITKSMLAWWASNDKAQDLLEITQPFQIEHIYPKKRLDLENNFSDKRNLESLGNKVLLEARINIGASDYKFADKIKYYEGFKNSRGQSIGKTNINELRSISQQFSDFRESEIVQRKALMIQKFIEYLRRNDLIE
ncbi:MAG: DUF262 domain-containing protein [Synergistaceae bacterium]|nr:DUF262 domain-containing protein [Synergistaceae bacterium]